MIPLKVACGFESLDMAAGSRDIGAKIGDLELERSGPARLGSICTKSGRIKDASSPLAFALKVSSKRRSAVAVSEVGDMLQDAVTRDSLHFNQKCCSAAAVNRYAPFQGRRQMRRIHLSSY